MNDALAEVSASVPGDPILNLLSRHFEKSADGLRTESRIALLRCLATPGSRFTVTGISGMPADLWTDINAFLQNPTDPKAWARNNQHRLPPSFSLTLQPRRGASLACSIDAQGRLSDDLTNILFDHLGDEIGASQKSWEKPERDSVEAFVEKSLAPVPVPGGGEAAFLSTALITLNGKLIAGVESDKGKWRFVSSDVVQGWKPHELGSQFTPAGDSELQQRVSMVSAVKYAFHLSDDDVKKLRFVVNRRHSPSLKARKSPIGQDVQQKSQQREWVHAEHKPQLSSADLADMRLYGDLLALPRILRRRAIMNNPNALVVDLESLDGVASKIPSIPPQRFSDDVPVSGAISRLREIYNKLLSKAGDGERVDVLIAELNQLNKEALQRAERNEVDPEALRQADLAELNEEALTHFSEDPPTNRQQALKDIFKRAAILFAHAQAEPYQHDMHQKLYESMLGKPLVDCVALLSKNGITTLNEEVLRSLEAQFNDPENVAFRGGLSASFAEFRAKLDEALEKVKKRAPQQTNMKDVYQKISRDGKALCVDYLTHEPWASDINENALVGFSTGQRATIRKYFIAVQEAQFKNAKSLYDAICSPGIEQDARVRLLKEKNVLPINQSALAAYSPENQRKILEAFIPVSGEQQAQECLYRILLTFPNPQHRWQRLLMDVNASAVHEDALQKLPENARPLIIDLSLNDDITKA